MNTSELNRFLRAGARCHLIGIGGVSMAPLAEVLLGKGIRVTGSDMSEGDTVLHLREKGIPIHIGHRPENIEGAECIIRTAAAREDNPEIVAARAAGIPVFERAQAWGYLMRAYKNALCIAGTHGKTTTTSMATHILMAADKDPTVMIGGTLPLLHAGHRVGQGDTIVLESCEYCNSFLSFSPTVAVILDIEAEHLDFFKDLEDVEHSFRAFASLVPESGTVVVNADDENTMHTVAGLPRRLVTFGFGEAADVRVVNHQLEELHQEFDLLYEGALLCHVSMPLPGRHNAADAAAAAAAALVLGVDGAAIARGLSTFAGAARRFEHRGTVNGAEVYDDYAHHPGELKSLLDMVENLHFRRILLAFQPHTYSRTKLFFEDFVTQLSRPARLFLAEIYAAREQNTTGISSAALAERIPGAVFSESLEELSERIRAEAEPGDIVLTVGAGNIYRVSEYLTKA